MTMIFLYSGMIGRNWAVLFASAGYSVSLFDVDSKQLSGAKVAVTSMLREGMAAVSDIDMQQFLALISCSDNLAECLEDAIYVQVLFELRGFAKLNNSKNPNKN